MQPTKKQSEPPAKFSFSIAIRSLSFLVTLALVTGCGTKNYDLSNESDRQAMLIDARNALTTNDCGGALKILTPLYQSAYTNNEVRTAYASAHACNLGIQLYTLIDSLSRATLNTPSDIFKTFVRLFPSKTATDSKMQSANFATDALQATLLPGVVLAPNDAIFFSTANPGSLLIRDLTNDANSYLPFVAMGSIGTVLNRYGFNPSDDPAATGYSKTVSLPWFNKAAVLADTTNSACTLSSGFFNLFDGINAIIGILTGGAASSLGTILAQLQTVITNAAVLQCTTDSYSTAQCSAAIARLRYRGACAEQPAAASATAGIVAGVNAGW